MTKVATSAAAFSVDSVQVLNEVEVHEDKPKVSITVSGPQKYVTSSRTASRLSLSLLHYLTYKEFKGGVAHLDTASAHLPDTNDKSDHEFFSYEDALNIDTDSLAKRIAEAYSAEKLEANSINMLARRAILSPTNQDIAELKEIFLVNSPAADFQSYLHNQINKHSPALAVTKVATKGTIYMLNPEGKHWLLLDFWGTWCKPCITQMPKIQQLHEYLQAENVQLKLLTLSYASVSLQQFMLKNNYTFPVAKVDDDFVEAFGVDGYPSYYLITPEGKVVEILFELDLIKSIENLTGFDLEFE
jgi:thiol-disulfide isomerase/thioredoxin